MRDQCHDDMNWRFKNEKSSRSILWGFAKINITTGAGKAFTGFCARNCWSNDVRNHAASSTDGSRRKKTTHHNIIIWPLAIVLPSLTMRTLAFVRTGFLTASAFFRSSSTRVAMSTPSTEVNLNCCNSACHEIHNPQTHWCRLIFSISLVTLKIIGTSSAKQERSALTTLHWLSLTSMLAYGTKKCTPWVLCLIGLPLVTWMVSHLEAMYACTCDNSVKWIGSYIHTIIVNLDIGVGEGVTGVYSGRDKISLYPGSLLALQEHAQGKYPGMKICFASSADTPFAEKVGRASLKMLEVIPGMTVWDLAMRDWDNQDVNQIGRQPPLSRYV